MADSRRVRIVVDADVLNAIRGLREVEGGLGRVGRQGQDTTQVTSSFGEKLAQGLANVGVATGFDAIKAGFSKVVSSGLDYESNMNQLQAVTGATADQMKKVGETAKALGNDVELPGASAQTTAAAMTELAKGGLTVQESMDAARGTMMLAAAAQIDGAQAAEIQSSALNTFGLSASEANRVADVLANTANASAGEITDFAQGMAQAGTVANSFGWSIEDTSTMLGLMANAGIKGSDAGTSLKTTMTALLSPTEKQSAALEELGVKTQDANGKMVSAQEFTSQLAAAKGRMSEADFTAAAATAFGTDAVRTSLVAAQAGTKGFDDMSTAIRKQGGAAEVAAANSVGLNGALDRINNAADTAALTLYETFSPALTGLVDFGTSAVGVLGSLAEKFGELPGPVQAISLALGGVILLRGPLGSTFTSLLGSLAGMRASFTGFAASLRGATGAAATFGVAARGALSVLGGPIGLAIVGVTTALSFMSMGTDDAADSVEGLGAAVDTATGKLTDNAYQLISQDLATRGVLDAYVALGGTVDDFVSALMGVPAAQAKVHEVLEAGRHDSENGGVAWETYTTAADGYTTAVDELDQKQRLGAQAAAASAGAQKQAADAAKSGAAATRDAGKASEEAETQTTTYSDAMKELKSATSEADAASQFLNITLLTLAGSDISAEQAARANEAAMRDVADAARNAADAHDTVTDAQTKLDEMTAHLGGTLDGEEASASNLVITQQDLDAQTRKVEDAKNREADASDNQKDAQDKAAQSARDMTAASYNSAKQTGSTEDAIKAATKTMEAQRKKFIESAVAAGVEQGAAEKLADAQGLIPKNVSTAYASPGIDEAFAKIQKVNSALASIDKKTFTANITAGYTNIEGTYTAEQQANRNNKRDGGPIIGMGGSREDNIPIWASNGEFMVNAASASKHRGTLEAINRDRFADGGLIGAQTNVSANADGADGFVKSIWAALDKDMAKAAEKAAMVSVSGFNSSQDPSSFGWVRAANQQPFSWNGQGATVAGGTQSLWTSLLDALNPTIIGGVTSIGGFDDRNNVNNPGVPSFHAYGLAMDVNAPENPNGVSAASIQGNRGAIPIGIAQQTAARLGMLWGGDFNGTPDPMHFEIHVAPSGIGVGGGLSSDIGQMPSGGSGVERWRARVNQALGMTGQPISYADYVLHQMDTESSGNPKAINLWDSNATVRGTPSKGLMQVIQPTFDAYRLPNLSSDIYDPLANIVASIRYVLDTYGSIPAGMRGVAYADGGIVPGGNSPRDDKVWAVASPGEAFLTNNQWATAKAAVLNQSSGGGTQRIIVEFRGDGPITNQMAETASYKVEAAMGELATAINRQRLQPTS